MIRATHSRARRVDSWARTLRTSVAARLPGVRPPSGCADGKSRRVSPAVTRTILRSIQRVGEDANQRHMKPGMDELAPDGAATLPSSLPGGVLRRVLEHIDANRHRALSLSELSALAHMSTFHFARLFKQSTGVSTHRGVDYFSDFVSAATSHPPPSAFTRSTLASMRRRRISISVR